MLRPYQQAAVDSVLNWCKYKDEPCIVEIATGGGKTHVIKALIEHFHMLGQRVCLLAHRKELLEQSGEKISVPFGYYSASVGEKDVSSQVIIAGVQSIYNKDFDKFDVVIVDECHHLANNTELGQYWQFIAKHQPCKLIGLTATPYRLQGGKLGWGEIIYSAGYNLLRDGGFLAPLTNKVKNTPDLTKVKIVAGEFNEGLLAEVMESPELIEHAVRNILCYGMERNSVLIFCVTVNHAKLLTEAMKANGLDSAVIHGQTEQGERDIILQDFKNGKVKHLINCEILLEGFDAPNVDMIACLRPTKSKALWEQMLGRGVRLHPDKEDCFILDMAGNLMEHGGLGTPYWDRAKQEAEPSKGRICPDCEDYCKPTDKECKGCGYVFPKEDPVKASHNLNADFSSGAAFVPLQEYEVRGMHCRHHKSKSGNDTLRVDYVCNTKYGSISEYLSPFHESAWARGKAEEFFKRGKHMLGMPVNTYSMEDLIFHGGNCTPPKKIIVDHSGKFPKIVRYVYEEPKPLPAADLLEDSIPW